MLIRLLNYVPEKFKGFFLNLSDLLGRTFLRKYIPLRSLYIEVTSSCNLRCKGCYRTVHDYKSKNKFISFDDFKKYVDQSPRASSLYLHGLGEPILHPDIKKIIEYASCSGKFNNVAFTTNTLAKEPESYVELFGSGLTQITLSVDSLVQSEVNKMRPSTNVKKLEENIKWLVGKFGDRVKISTVVNNVNRHTIEGTLEKLRKLGVREVSFHPYADLGYPELCISFEDGKEFIEKLNSLDIGMKFYPSGFTPTEVFCNLPSTAPVITVTGYLTPCCRIYDEKVVNLGNLKNKSFKEIFFSKKYLEMQKNIEARKYPNFCRGCMGNHVYVSRFRKV